MRRRDMPSFLAPCDPCTGPKTRRLHCLHRLRRLPETGQTAMPETYFGNLIQAIFTVKAAGLSSANPPEFGPSLIQKAIEAHTAKAIDERNKEWESAPKIFQFKDAGVNCVEVGSSARFKVYDVDFEWGPPENVRSGSNKFDGMVCLYPRKSGRRSLDVELTLESEATAKLEEDKEFLMEV